MTKPSLIIYNIFENQFECPDEAYNDEKILVYLADESQKVHKKYPYYASGYEKDENQLYLFFDGACYIREDYQKSSNPTVNQT